MNIIRNIFSRQNKRIININKPSFLSEYKFNFNYKYSLIELDNGVRIITENNPEEDLSPWVEILLDFGTKHENFNTSGTLWRFSNLWRMKYDSIFPQPKIGDK